MGLFDCFRSASGRASGYTPSSQSHSQSQSQSQSHPATQQRTIATQEQPASRRDNLETRVEPANVLAGCPASSEPGKIESAADVRKTTDNSEVTTSKPDDAVGPDDREQVLQQSQLSGTSVSAGEAPSADEHPQILSVDSTVKPATTDLTTPKPEGHMWNKAKEMFKMVDAPDLLKDLRDFKFIGAGGYGKVYKAVWRSTPVAIKLVPSQSPELYKSGSYKEALLCKELSHPNIVQTFETRCAQLSDEFIRSMIGADLSVQLAPQEVAAGASTGQNPLAAGGIMGGSTEFVSGDGFGQPAAVGNAFGMLSPEQLAVPEEVLKWKEVLFTTGVKGNDYLSVVIMDYCDYGSLVRPIVKCMFKPVSNTGNDREARVRYRALLRTAREIAQGLDHLHHLNVVHGDLKPGNVLLKGSRGDVRGFTAQVIDFGLAHLVQNSKPQQVSKAGGTLIYAAPEVFNGKVGKAADIYSLGIILWEMVTGAQPYKDMNEAQIVVGVQRQNLRPIWPEGQLARLGELYARCVDADPEARPKAPEVVAFLADIENEVRSELKLRAAAEQSPQPQQPTARAPPTAAPVPAAGQPAPGARQSPQVPQNAQQLPPEQLQALLAQLQVQQQQQQTPQLQQQQQMQQLMALMRQQQQSQQQ